MKDIDFLTSQRPSLKKVSLYRYKTPIFASLVESFVVKHLSNKVVDSQILVDSLEPLLDESIFGSMLNIVHLGTSEGSATSFLNNFTDFTSFVLENEIPNYLFISINEAECEDILKTEALKELQSKSTVIEQSELTSKSIKDFSKFLLFDYPSLSGSPTILDASQIQNLDLMLTSLQGAYNQEMDLYSLKNLIDVTSLISIQDNLFDPITFQTLTKVYTKPEFFRLQTLIGDWIKSTTKESLTKILVEVLTQLNSGASIKEIVYSLYSSTFDLFKVNASFFDGDTESFSKFKTTSLEPYRSLKTTSLTSWLLLLAKSEPLLNSSDFIKQLNLMLLDFKASKQALHE